MKRQKVFTQEELSKITSLFEQGLGARKIALALSLTRQPIRRALNILGLEHPKGYVNPQFKIVGTHQKCTNSRCGQVKPILDFTTKIKNGKLIYLAQCIECDKTNHHEAHKRKLQKLGKITRPKNNAPVLQEELAQIKSFFEQGLTRKQIGNILSRSAIRISKAYKELGLIGKSGTTTRVSKE